NFVYIMEGAQMTNWVISCNLNHYNVIDAFKKLNTLHWKQSTNVQAGDIVFIYVTNPIGAIKFKTKVNKVDLPYVEIDDQEFIIDGTNYEHHNRYMELELLRTYNDDLFTYDVDRKSTRLNSSHVSISYAVFCLKKKNKQCHLV